MSKHRMNLIVSAAMVLAVGAAAFAQEDKFLAILKSDAAHKAKADACRELSRVATAKSVPTLAGMLADEKLGHMARYALEPIPDPSVDQALRDAMGKLKGMPLVGVIGSLGVRHDARAIPAMAKLLNDADPEVARAAGRALGKIGGPDAVKALTAALTKAKGRQLRAVCEGLFRCAEEFAAAKKSAPAVAIYDRLRALEAAPHQVRTGAIRGAVLARDTGQLPVLLEALRDKRYVVFNAAIRTSMELPGKAVTKAMLDAMKTLGADRQLLMVQTLGARGDADAGDALLVAAGKGPLDVRLAAITSLTRLGHAPAVPLLTELALGNEAKLAATAQKCLANFPGKQGQAAVLALLGHKDPKARRLAVEMVSRRALAGATPMLLKAARDADADVRATAIKVLRDIAGAEDLQALLALLIEAKDATTTRGAEEALRTLCAREASTAGGKIAIRKAVYGDLPNGKQANVTKKVAKLVKGGAMSVEASNGNFGDPVQGTPKRLRVDYTINGVSRSQTVSEKGTITFGVKIAPPAFVEAFCAALPKAPAPAKAALLRILRSAGGAIALKTVRDATADRDETVQDAALRALFEWPTADALPAVSDIARTTKNATHKVLAVRACIRLAVQQIAPPAQLVQSLQAALALAERPQEKRLVISALGSIPATESLSVVTGFLTNASLKEEACLAAVAIGEKIVKSNAKAVADAMETVARTSSSRQVKARAQMLRKAAQRQ